MSNLRISGLSSGLDIDQIVRDLMSVERVKADKLAQKKQVMAWQKEQYRGLINNIRSFKDSFFNLTKPETNITSAATFKKMTASSSDPLLSVTANAGALSGDSTIRIIQSAIAAKAVAQQVCLDSSSGMRLSLSDTMETVSSKLTGEFIFAGDSSFTVTINNIPITINKDDTFGDVLNRINSSDAQVQAYYSSFSDTVTFTAKSTGSGYISTDDGGSFFSAMGLTVNEGTIGTAGRDAQFEINGVPGTDSHNSFTIDGISYNITASVDTPTEIITISARQDADSIYNTIEKFINGYNSLVDTVNSKLREERFSEYPPLTDEQKGEMSDREIKLWEEKAQSGLLRRDLSLESMLRNMRMAIYGMVGEAHIAQIGIETSNNYQDQGKLVLTNGGADLREAIANNPDKVANIFTRSSDIPYDPDNTAADKTLRYHESGIAHRLSDIINDNIRITRDSYGLKGILLEKAGIEGDVSEFVNAIDKRINEIDRQIERVNVMLAQKEEHYYRQFTAMEKALEQLYTQSDWLMMQLDQWSR